MTKARVFISVPTDENLDSRQRTLKHAILDGIRTEGFEPQEFLVSGLALHMPYSFANAYDVISRCQGALVLAFARWRTRTPVSSLAVPTVWNHYEGALALAL
jgi:hypothetical protein